MDKEIRKIRPIVLVLIVILIPINQILLNYLFKIHFFTPITKVANYWVQPTLVANLLSLIVFSVLIFVIGKHNLSSVWFSKDKLKTAAMPIITIWLLSQIITIVATVHSNEKVVLVDGLHILFGSLIGQLLGNATFEELLFRGIFFLQLYLLLKPKTKNNAALIISIIVSQILFAMIHIPNRLMINQVENLGLDMLGLFVVGIVLTTIYLRTKNLAFVIGVHTLINQPFNMIESSFPMEISIYVFIILTTIFWHKFVPDTSSKLKTYQVESDNISQQKI